MKNLRFAWKKFLPTLGIALTLGANAAFAQAVTVTGMGDDRSGALRDAQRNAVMQVVGTYIDSRTLVENAVVALDEIYAKAYGFVKSVDILDEGREGDTYKIRARIDVDTNPNSALLGQLQTVAALNDPRIAVVMEARVGEGKGKYLEILEGAVNEKLIAQGFSHVVASRTARDEAGTVNLASRAVDYLVLGQLDLHTAAIVLPKYADYTNEDSGASSVETGLTRTIADIDAKIIKTDTQEVVGEFRVEEDGIRNDENGAENQATERLAAKAAEEVRKLFARAGASVNSNVQIIARAESQDALMKLEAALRSLPGVRGVTLRGYEGGKGTLHVDTDMKPQQLLRRLQEAGTNVFLEQMSANVLEISI